MHSQHSQHSHHAVVRDTAEFGLVRMVAVIAAIMPCAALIQVLASAGDYRLPAVAIVVWLGVFAAAAWFVPRLRTGGLTAGEAAAALGVAIAAVAAIGWDHRAASGRADLAIVGTVWLLALVALSRPARVWLPGALAVLAVHAVLVFLAVGVNRLSLAQFEAGCYIVVISQGAFALVRPTLAVLTSVTARRAELASRSAAERAAAAAVTEERRSRLALLEMEALPLLRGIADGALDVDQVRQRCAWHAEVLRNSLVGRPQPGRPLAGLEPALRAAADRGLLVDVRVIGDPEVPPPPVAHAVLLTVDAVLGALPPQQATLTVLAHDADVELYLTFVRPPPRLPDVTRTGQDAGAGWHAAVTAECLEITWRKDGST